MSAAATATAGAWVHFPNARNACAYMERLGFRYWPVGHCYAKPGHVAFLNRHTESHWSVRHAPSAMTPRATVSA